MLTDKERFKQYEESMKRWETKKNKFGFILPTHHMIVFNSKSDVTYFINAVLFNAIYYEHESTHSLFGIHINDEFTEIEKLFGITFNFLVENEDEEFYDTSNLNTFDETVQCYNGSIMEPRAIMIDDVWEFNKELEYPIICHISYGSEFDEFMFVEVREVMNQKYKSKEG